MAGHSYVVGDSFSDAAGEWPTLILTTTESVAAGGDEVIVDIQPNYAANLAARAGGTVVTQAFLQGGVNDIRIAGATAAQILAATAAMVATALATENIERVFVLGIAPWKNHAGPNPWTAAHQIVTDEYNALLAANQATYSYTYVNIYDPLEGPADELAAMYDSGDGIHPNAAGHAVIAAAVDALLGDFEVSFATLPHESWIGAIEPFGAGSVGNEYAGWIGAGEPAYEAPVVPPTPTGDKMAPPSSGRGGRHTFRADRWNMFVETFEQYLARQERINQPTRTALHDAIDEISKDEIFTNELLHAARVKIDDVLEQAETEDDILTLLRLVRPGR